MSRDHPDTSKEPLSAPVLPITPRSAAALLLCATLVISIACLTASFFRFVLGTQHGPLNVIRLLNFGGEANVPTWFAVLLLFMSAQLLGLIGLITRRGGERWARHWIGLSIIFVLLSLDEACSLHERLEEPMHRLFHTEGILMYGWVIPGMVLVAALGFLYLRFVLNLPARTRRLIILSGVIYVTGALVLEMVEGGVESRVGSEALSYGMLVAVEEMMELFGLVLFIYALLDYVALRWNGATLAITSEGR